MRNKDDICLLCKKNKADCTNSHIIPKFLTKGLFNSPSGRYAMAIEKKGGSNSATKIQDTIKEDNILCNSCEKGFEIYETYCALRLDRYDQIRFSNQFKHSKNGIYEFAECIGFNSIVFNLFIYSIVWRASISEHIAFEAFDIPTKEEDKLRQFLAKFTSATQADLLFKTDNDITLPNHKHILARPKTKLRPPESILAAKSVNKTGHELKIVDYIIFYFSNSNDIKDFELINNNRTDSKVKLSLLNPEYWKNFHRSHINKFNNN